MNVHLKNNVANLKGTWKQAFLSVLIPIFFILTLRWAIIEPFVIPSGSMIPTLLIHDHVLANKLSYGWHWPFSRKWLLRWSNPNRGDILVFRYPKNPEIYFVKRIIGVEGDRIEISLNGQVRVNGTFIPQKEQMIPINLMSDVQGTETELWNNYEYFLENESYWVRYLKRKDNKENFYRMNSDSKIGGESLVFQVPSGHYFALGDNRDESQDSRFWGFIPDDHIVGKAFFIWLSCSEMLPASQYLCDPQQMRWNRIGMVK